MSGVLAVDIGNSNIVIGFFDGSEYRELGRLKSDRDFSEDEIAEGFADLISKAGLKDRSFDGSVLSSVVTEMTDKAAGALKKITGKDAMIPNTTMNTGIDVSRYDTSCLGFDRVADLAAAVSEYGCPVMVCDLGTCTTVTVADEKARLVGGMICPGVQLSLDAEAQRTSKLPQLTARKTDKLLGTDTESNMISGAVAGTGIMLTGLIKKVINEHGFDDLKVVITGGWSEAVAEWMDAEVIRDPDLLMRGLLTVYNRNR
ncbi:MULTISPECIES: type III pantothenate kinase [Butyrivibrio]|uniref:type III pantothenate kinase n=1 Tax=Butyrivibrio TaxID=830 RepID=UPI000427856B|nr:MULTISPECIES: type III pantothenate kinase [Butyrivibrio]